MDSIKRAARRRVLRIHQWTYDRTNGADEINKGGYTEYQARTARLIPVVVLDPVS